MDKNSTGFTPVRRSIKPDQDSPRGTTSSATSWTSARCKRLLRPITSRLATLRKEARCSSTKRVARLEKEDISEVNEQYSIGPGAFIDSEQGTTTSHHELGLDEDWQNGGGPRKRIRRTYSKKDNASQRTRHALNVVGDGRKVTLVQPLLRIDQQMNLIVTLFTPSLLNPPQRQDVRSQPSIVPKMQRNGKVSRHNYKSLAKNVRPSQWALYDGIFAGLDVLLKATASTSPPKQTGAPSLFSTCIRRVPYLIALEEREARISDKHSKEDVEGLIFAEVEENLSTSSDGCWKPFKDICRSQAIMLLEQAIRDGLMPLSLADGLVHLLIDHQAIREAKTLVKTMLSTVKSIRDPDTHAESFYSHEISYSLQALNRLGMTQIGFLFEMITLLLATGALPNQWCAHPDFIYIWNRVLYSITTSDCFCAQAIRLLEVSMKRRVDSGTTDWSTSRDCMSWDAPLLGIMSALVSVMHTSSMPLGLGNKPAVLPGYCLQALKSLALGTADLNVSEGFKDKIEYAHTLNLVVACPSAFSNEGMAGASLDVASIDSVLFIATRFLEMSISFAAQELDAAEVDVLRVLVDGFTTRPEHHANSWLLRESALRVLQSFMNSKNLGDRQDWAENIMAKYRPPISSNKQPDQVKQRKEGSTTDQAVASESFRWDDSVNDFVVCSLLELPHEEELFLKGQYEADEPLSTLDFEAVAAQATLDLDGTSSPESASDDSSTDKDQLTPITREASQNKQRDPSTNRGTTNTTHDTSSSVDLPSKMEPNRSLATAKLIEASAQNLSNLSFDLQIGTSQANTKPRAFISKGLHQSNKENEQHRVFREDSELTERKQEQISGCDLKAPQRKQVLSVQVERSSVSKPGRLKTSAALLIHEESEDELCM